MAYTPTTWVDSENKYNIVRNTDDVVTDSDIRLVYTGTGGTPLSAANLNNIEDELVFLDTQYRLPDYSSIATTRLAITPFATGTLDAPMKYQMEGVSVAYLSYDIDVATSGTVTFESTLDNKYFDSLHNTILTGTGSTMTITNDTGAIADIGIIEMDTFGIEIYTVSQMTDISNAMQAGTDIQSAIVDIKSVGKNLFDKNKVIPNKSVSDGTGVISDYTAEPNNGITDYIIVEGSTNYFHTYITSPDSGRRLAFYDKDKNYISGLSGGDVISFTTPSNAYYVVFNVKNYILENIQLEKGTSATAYEPYKQNLLQPNIELKSVPAISDTLVNAVVDPNDSNKLLRLDKAVHTKNVESYTLQSGDIITADTNETFNERYEIDCTPFDIDTSVFENSIQGILLISGYIEIDYGDYVSDTEELPLSFATTSGSTLWIIVPKGTYADLSAAQADLAGTVIQYQLTEPVATELDIDEMYSFENGVLYQNGIPTSVDYTTATNQSAVIKGIGDVVENLDDAVSELVVIDKIITLLSTGWTDDTATSGYWYYQVTDSQVDVDTIVDFNPSISNDFGDNSVLVSTESFAGYYRVYALSEPAGNISATAKKVK